MNRGCLPLTLSPSRIAHTYTHRNTPYIHQSICLKPPPQTAITEACKERIPTTRSVYPLPGFLRWRNPPSTPPNKPSVLVGSSLILMSAPSSDVASSDEPTDEVSGVSASGGGEVLDDGLIREGGNDGVAKKRKQENIVLVIPLMDVVGDGERGEAGPREEHVEELAYCLKAVVLLLFSIFCAVLRSTAFCSVA